MSIELENPPGAAGTSGPVAAADITDAGTAGIAAIKAETPAQLREAAEAAGYDPTEMVIAHAGGAVVSQQANSPATYLSGSRYVLEMSSTAGCAVAVTNQFETVQPEGGAENYRSLDSLCSVSFSFSLNAIFANLVWRCGFGKRSTDAIGDWSNKGFGFVLRGTALSGWYYAGGVLTEVPLDVTVTINQSRRLTIERTGAGIVWYVNGYKKGEAAVSAIGPTLINTGWRHELTNGATASATRLAVSVNCERVVSPIDSGIGQREGAILSGLSELEVGGYRTKTIPSPINYHSLRPEVVTQCRFYLVPRGSTAAVPETQAIAGLKLFGTDFDADQANYDDFGIYNAPQGLTFNSKRLGTGAVKSFLFVDQDTTPFVKVDVVTREVELLLAGKGIVMKSPDGTRYRLTIANGGTVSVAAVT